MNLIHFAATHDLEIANAISAFADAASVIALLWISFSLARKLSATLRMALFYAIFGCSIHIYICFLRVFHYPTPDSIARAWVLKDVGMAMLVVWFAASMKRRVP